MNSIASTALSGMQAAQSQLAASGHNIANAQTAGFRRQSVETATAAGGGVTASVRTAPEPGEDLAADVVNQLAAKHAFVANLQVFRTHDRMTGALLDAKG